MIVTPETFGAAIAVGGIPPGTVVQLQPGDYDTPGAAWQCKVSGTHAAPITFQGGPGVRIGPITISGAWLVWEDCEFAYPHWTTRTSPTPGSNPQGVFFWARLLIYGKGATLRRCIIHDFADVGWGVGASDSLMEDCLTYNIGWEASDRAHGHGWYIQNDSTGPKTMRRCVSVLCYATPTKVYGANAPLEDITIDSCVFAFGKEGYTYVRSDNGAAHNVTIRNLYTYGVQWEHSNSVAGGGPLTVDGGVIVAPDIDWYAYQGAKNWQAGASIRGLQIAGRRAISYWKDTMPLPFMDGNSYHVIPPSVENAPFVQFGGPVSSTLAAWRAATGNDANSTYQTTLPAEPRIEVIQRSQDSIVVIYNWQGADSVVAPVSGVYRNAFNLEERLPVVSGNALPMDIWSVAAPSGAATPVAPWDGRFAVFLSRHCP